MESLYNFLYTGLELQTAGLILGVVLILVHLIAWLQGRSAREFLIGFPRNKVAGIVLLAICGIWSWMLISEMDLGEFFTIRQAVKMLIPIGFFLIVFYVDEFLSVRALGVLLLLLASPILHSAFLEAPVTRLLLPFLAYAWIIVGMFWIDMPFLMRDWINWLVEKPEKRYGIACGLGAFYGLAILVCAVVAW